MKVLLFVASLAIFAPLLNAEDSQWQKEPKDFRGIPFGATEAVVSSKLKLDAVSCLTIEEQRTCIHHTTLGDVKTTEIYQFDEDRLVQVHLSFKPDQFPLLRDMFVKQYGKPTETWTEPFETVGSGNFTNEILVWNGEKMVLQVEKFGPSTRESTAVLATREWYDRTAED